jgi:hypothetical protein
MSKMATRKSKSPSHNTSNNEGDIGDDQEEDKQTKQVPNTLIVNKKGVRPTRAVLPITTTHFTRKARSNSPKESSTVKINPATSQHTANKCRSPQNVSPRAIDIPKKKEGELSVKEGSTHKENSKYGITTKILRANQGKGSPDRSPANSDAAQNRHAKSPRPVQKFQPFDSEETKALKAIAKKKHQLNEELWEAAGDGDLVKISRLLEPYYTIRLNSF